MHESKRAELQAVEPTVYDTIEERAAITSDARAIVSWDIEFTYDRPVGLTSRFARVLVSMVTTLGYCVSLDPNDPTRHWEYLVSESGTRIILTASNHASKFRNANVKILLVDRSLLESLEASATITDLACADVTPSDAAMVLFTSESTG